jgi:hypothetical protein
VLAIQHSLFDISFKKTMPIAQNASFTGLEGTILFKQNYCSTAHTIINQGGTSSGKTYAIEQVLFCIACAQEKQVITVVGQDIPNLKAGALRDALSIYADSNILQSLVKSYNKSDRIFEFHNGTVTTETRINNIRLKILEEQVALLQKQIINIRSADVDNAPSAANPSLLKAPYAVMLNSVKKNK